MRARVDDRSIGQKLADRGLHRFVIIAVEVFGAEDDEMRLAGVDPIPQHPGDRAIAAARRGRAEHRIGTVELARCADLGLCDQRGYAGKTACRAARRHPPICDPRVIAAGADRRKTFLLRASTSYQDPHDYGIYSEIGPGALGAGVYPPGQTYCRTGMGPREIAVDYTPRRRTLIDAVALTSNIDIGSGLSITSVTAWGKGISDAGEDHLSGAGGSIGHSL